jgi:hypothetical protein
MKLIDSIIRNERGTVLVVALMILVILTIIGIVVVTTSTRNIQIAGYDVLYKQAFYNADAGISFLVGTSPSTTLLAPGDTIVPIGTIGDFELIYLRQLSTVPPPNGQIEVQSNGQDKNGKAFASIIAGYQYPSGGTGALPGPGYEGAY